MMRMCVLVIAATATILARTATADPAMTTQAASHAEVATGDYKNLGLWEKVRLGSAYFISPQSVSATPIAYVFEAAPLTTSDKSSKLLRLAQDGKVRFATWRGDGEPVRVFAISDLADRGAPMKADDLAALLNSQDIHVIAGDASLLGSKPVATLVRQEPSLRAARPDPLRP